MKYMSSDWHHIHLHLVAHTPVGGMSFRTVVHTPSREVNRTPSTRNDLHQTPHDVLQHSRIVSLRAAVSASSTGQALPEHSPTCHRLSTCLCALASRRVPLLPIVRKTLWQSVHQDTVAVLCIFVQLLQHGRSALSARPVQPQPVL